MLWCTYAVISCTSGLACTSGNQEDKGLRNVNKKDVYFRTYTKEDGYHSGIKTFISRRLSYIGRIASLNWRGRNTHISTERGTETQGTVEGGILTIRSLYSRRRKDRRSREKRKKEAIRYAHLTPHRL